MALQELSPHLESKYFVLPDGSRKELTSDLFEGKYVVCVIFYAAFNDISTEELVYFDKAIDEVDTNVEIIGMCRESTFAIVDWMNTIGHDFQNIKIVSDLRVDGMTGKFGANGNKGYPNPFTAIIDPHHKIRHICEHTPHIGRSVKETLRLVKTIQEIDHHNGYRVAPANYQPGVDWYITNTKMGVDSYYKKEQYYLHRIKSIEEDKKRGSTENNTSASANGSMVGSAAGSSSVYETAAGSKSASQKGSVMSTTTSNNTLITWLTGMASKMFAGDKSSVHK
jgi:alkyl hydroperoxide reductase subunit AhpC